MVEAGWNVLWIEIRGEKMDLRDYEIEKIWKRMSDDMSKEIFINRIMFYMTGDFEFIKNTVMITKEGMFFYEKLRQSDEKKVIFGAGSWGKNILTAFSDIHFECFVDNSLGGKGSSKYGLPVLSFEQFMETYSDTIVVIASRVYNAQIYEQLIKEGICKDRILNAGEIIDQMNISQYFDLPELPMSRDRRESFVDVGCLDGRTSILFAKWCHNNYDHIWAFEPDMENRLRCEEEFKNSHLRNYVLIPKGAWDSETTLRFQAAANGLSRIEDEGNTSIEVTTLDHIIGDKPVTFIKMDIEGAEYRAILGAKHIIEKQSPKLAISIYHKPEDIITLPQLILKINPNYKFYLRHYSISALETVLYAFVE